MSKKKVSRKKHPSAYRPKDSGLTEEDHDEIDHFHSKKDQILLEENDDHIVDSDEADYNPDAILDLPDSEPAEARDEDAELFVNDDEVEDAIDQDHDWGRGRKNYYSADQDGEEEEAAEAERLYKKKLSSLTPQDYGLQGGPKDGPKRVAIKSVTFDSEPEESPVQQTDELRLVEEELERAVLEVKQVLQPFIDKVAKGDYPRSEGLSFLQTKYNLLLHYCINSVYYVKARASGKTLNDDHPVMERLIKYRMLIEKTKPLEAKLKYQIDRLLKAANDREEASTGSEHVLRPHTELIKRDNEEVAGGSTEDGDKSAKYHPPKIIQTEMFDKSTAKTDRPSRIQRDLLREELYDEEAPEEEDIDPVKRVGGTKATTAVDKVEEENFVRFSLPKKEKRRLAEQSKIVDGLDDLNDMFDEFERRRGKKMTEDEADVVIKTKQSKQSAPSSESEIESDSGAGDYYEQVKAQKDARRNRPPPPKKVQFRDIADMDDKHPRPASRSIITNRGLTPSRPKDTKNPRIKQRKRYERANKRLGSFRPVVKTSQGPYRGESTGIRTNITRSAKF